MTTLILIILGLIIGVQFFLILDLIKTLLNLLESRLGGKIKNLKTLDLLLLQNTLIKSKKTFIEKIAIKKIITIIEEKTKKL